MKEPKISVILSTYNDEKYIDRTIASVITQTYKNWELIILNDGSTDSTPSIIKRYIKNDNRILFLNSNQRKGVTERLNEGIEVASGEYLAHIDGDDIWIDKDKLTVQSNFLNKNHDYILVGTWGKAIDSMDNYLFNMVYPSDDIAIKKNILLHNYFIHSSILTRFKEVKNIGGYNKKYLYAQDYYLWLELGKFGKVHNLSKFMVGYRLNPNGISQTRYKLQMEETIEIIEKLKNIYPKFYKSLAVWRLRKYYPKWIRTGSYKKLFKLNKFMHSAPSPVRRGSG